MEVAYRDGEIDIDNLSEGDFVLEEPHEDEEFGERENILRDGLKLASEQEKEYDLRDAILYAVDTRDNMLIPASSTHKVGDLLQVALQCVSEVMKDKIVTRERDFIGVLPFGRFNSSIKTDNRKKQRVASNNSGEIQFPMELGIPSASRISALDKLSSDPSMRNQYLGIPVAVQESSLMPRFDSDFSFHSVLLAAKKLFASVSSARGKPTARKKLVIFTNDDDPSRGSEVQLDQAIGEAVDLAYLGVSIHLVYFRGTHSPSVPLDASKFYRAVLCQGNRPDENIDDFLQERVLDLAWPGVGGFASFRSSIRAKQHRKRADLRSRFYIGNGLGIDVVVYCLVRRASIPRQVTLEKGTNQPTRVKQRMWCTATGKSLKDSDIRFGMEYAGILCPFTSAELNTLHRMAPPEALGLRLYGFAPKDALLKRRWNFATARFVYPNKSVSKKPGMGSDVMNALHREKDRVFEEVLLFTSLYERMLERGQVAVVLDTLRRASVPRFALLVPQHEKRDESGAQVRPPGFLLVSLPYEDDFAIPEHDIEDTWEAKVSEDDFEKRKLAAQKAIELIQTMNFPSGHYNPEDHVNPAIHRYYSRLQTLALEGGEVDGADIKKEIVSSEIASMDAPNVKELGQEWATLTVGCDFDPEMMLKPKTRERELKSKERAEMKDAARVSAQEELEELGLWQFLRNLEDEDIQGAGAPMRITLQHLMMFCKAHGVKQTGKKGDVLARIIDLNTSRKKTEEK